MIEEFIVKFTKLHPDAIIPTQAKGGDAGYDLFALESVLIRPFERAIVKTGIAMAIPLGFYGRIAPRSGLAVKAGIDVLAGVIDSGYRDEVGAVLINLNTAEYLSLLLSKERVSAIAMANIFGLPGEFRIKRGDRIAQLIIEKCHCVEWQETATLQESARGTAGFGSTGV